MRGGSGPALALAAWTWLWCSLSDRRWRRSRSKSVSQCFLLLDCPFSRSRCSFSCHAGVALFSNHFISSRCCHSLFVLHLLAMKGGGPAFASLSYPRLYQLEILMSCQLHCRVRPLVLVCDGLSFSFLLDELLVQCAIVELF